MNEDKNLTDNLMSSKSMLNVDAQKELIDHAIEKSTKMSLKIFLIVFPVMIVTILLVLGVVFYFTGAWKF
jgi:hypothetical protein